MTYVTGGPIQANDYNSLATLTSSVNEVYADLHPGATSLGALADFGYGVTPPLASVSIGQNVAATSWQALFTAMRAVGTHQGTTVSPPVPVSGPSTGAAVAALNTPSTMASIVALLRTNRHNLAVGQSTLTVGSNFSQTGATIPWTNTLTFNYQVNFGSWNNARYFFNAGGSLNLNGSYTPTSTPDDIMWAGMLTNMSPLVFNWNSCTPNVGSGGTAIGFYNLTTSYQTVYTHTHGGGGYYTNSYIQVQSKLNAAAGTNGLVDFSVTLVDLDSTPPIPAKSGTTTFRIDNVRATGAITYPGTVSVSAVGANNGFIAT